MVKEDADTSPRLRARIAGVLYALTGVFVFDQVVFGRLVVYGDAAATAHNILEHQMLFRLGLAAHVIADLCNFPLAVIFYGLFKVVDRSVASLVAFLILAGTVVDAVSLLGHLAPLVLLGGNSYLTGLKPEELQSLTSISLELFQQGVVISLAFFGCYCLSMGYLVFRSTFLPRIVGVLMAIGGVAYLTNSFANFLAPAFARHLFPYILVFPGFGEGSLILSLLVIGVNVQRWREQAGVGPA